MTSTTQYKKKSNRMSMADELSKEMNLLLENTNLNRKNWGRPKHSASVALPQIYRQNNRQNDTIYNPNSNRNTKANPSDFIPHSLSSSYIYKNYNQPPRILYPENLEDKYKSLYETTETSSSVYTNDINNTTFNTTTATVATNNPSENDYTNTMTSDSESYSEMTTTEQYSEYTSASELPTEQFSEYTETSTDPSNSILYTNSQIYNSSQSKYITYYFIFNYNFLFY